MVDGLEHLVRALALQAQVQGRLCQLVLGFLHLSFKRKASEDFCWTFWTTEYIDRVLELANWDPLSQPTAECVSPPLFQGGGAHSLAGEVMEGVPIATRGQTLWYSTYICN